MNSVNFKVLEGVRGLAAFAVVLNHARGNLFIGGELTSPRYNHPASGITLLSLLCKLQVLVLMRSLCFLCCQAFVSPT